MGKFNAIIYSFLLFLVLFPENVISQEVDIKVKGTLYRYGKKCEGATIKLFKDGKLEKRITTTSNGKFQFELIEAGREYLVEFSKADHIPVKIGISTKLPQSKKIKDFVIGDFSLDVGLVERFPNLDVSLFERPIAIIKYLEKENRFDYDDTWFSQVNSKLEKLMREAENMHQAGARPIPDSEVVSNAEQQKKQKEEAERKAMEEADRKQKEEADRKRIELELKAREQAEAITRLEAERKQKEDELKIGSTPIPEVGLRDKKIISAPEKSAKKDSAPFETELMKIAKKKQLREEEAKRNKTTKASYENELLKIAAETERKHKAQDYDRMKQQTEINSAIKRKEKEEELKTFYAPLLKETLMKEADFNFNVIVKQHYYSGLLETVAKVEKKEKEIKTASGIIEKKQTASIDFSEEVEEGFFSTSHKIISEMKGIKTIFKKVIFVWGSEYFYIDDATVEKEIYETELNKKKQMK